MGVTEFDVVYDDFSGGYFVGPRAAEQPKNTWRGLDVMAVASDGMLMAHKPVASDTTTFSALGPSYGLVLPTDAIYIHGGGATMKYSTNATDPTAFTNHDRDASGEELGWTWSSYTLGGGYTFSGTPVYFNGSVYTIIDGSPMKLAQGGTAGATLPGTTPRLLTAWGSWLLVANGKRVYFCDPYDPTSWPAANYFDVGNSAVVGMVPTPNALIVATYEAFWQVTGVLGETTVVRQINVEGPPDPTSGLVVADATSEGALMTAGRAYDKSLAMMLTGTALRPVAWDSSWSYSESAIDLKMAKSGSHFIIYGNANQFYVRAPNGTWRRLTANAAQKPVIQAAHPDAAYTIFAVNGTIYLYPLEPSSPMIDTSGAFPSATASLAPIERKRPFTVREVVAEVDFGYARNSAEEAATRSLSVSMATPGGEDISARVVSSRASTAATVNYGAVAADGTMVQANRLLVNDGGPTYWAQPKVTLKGVKLRRLIVRCTEGAG